jgi:hypothetical protein
VGGCGTGAGFEIVVSRGTGVGIKVAVGGNRSFVLQADIATASMLNTIGTITCFANFIHFSFIGIIFWVTV